jgi:hypothetical protein
MCVIPLEEVYPDGTFYKVLQKDASPLFVGTDGKYFGRQTSERYVPGDWYVSKVGDGFCLFTNKTQAEVYANLAHDNVGGYERGLEIWKCAATEVNLGEIADGYLGHNEGLSVFLAKRFQLLEKVCVVKCDDV